MITCSCLTVKFEVARILNQASFIWNPIDERLMHYVLDWTSLLNRMGVRGIYNWTDSSI